MEFAGQLQEFTEQVRQLGPIYFVIGGLFGTHLMVSALRALRG